MLLKINLKAPKMLLSGFKRFLKTAISDFNKLTFTLTELKEFEVNHFHAFENNTLSFTQTNHPHTIKMQSEKTFKPYNKVRAHQET